MRALLNEKVILKSPTIKCVTHWTVLGPCTSQSFRKDVKKNVKLECFSLKTFILKNEVCYFSQKWFVNDDGMMMTGPVCFWRRGMVLRVGGRVRDRGYGIMARLRDQPIKSRVPTFDFKAPIHQHTYSIHLQETFMHSFCHLLPIVIP